MKERKFGAAYYKVRTLKINSWCNLGYVCKTKLRYKVCVWEAGCGAEGTAPFIVRLGVTFEGTLHGADRLLTSNLVPETPPLRDTCRLQKASL